MFDDWNTKLVKRFRKIYPFIDDLYTRATATKLRVNVLRAKFNIQSAGAKHRQLTAFYLGAIEGDIRMALPMHNKTAEELIDTIFSVALYTAVKNKDVNNDGEWGSLAAEYHQVLFDNDNDWYRKRGLGYAAILGADPEKNWEQLVAKLSENSA